MEINGNGVGLRGPFRGEVQHAMPNFGWFYYIYVKWRSNSLVESQIRYLELIGSN
jgi:hypothetical protein